MNAEIKDLGKRDIIQIILTEYIALRQEIICCLTTQYQALAFGVPVIGAAFVAGFNWWGREISILIFSIVIPYLILMCLLFWGNQVARMNRAGAYISDFIESKLEILAGEEYRRFFPQLKEPSSEFKLPSLSWELKEQFGGDKRVESIEETFRSVLSWETWLRSKGLQQFYKSFKPWKYYPYTQLSVILKFSSLLDFCKYRRCPNQPVFKLEFVYENWFDSWTYRRLANNFRNRRDKTEKCSYS